MEAGNDFPVAQLPDGSRRISPTDVSGFLQYGQCWRHLRLRLHERTAGAKSFQEFGAPLQKAPKLLTKAGVEFEKQVYADIDRLSERIDFERVKAGGGRQTADNDRVADIASQLAAGRTIILTQPRLEAKVRGWTITGLVDLLRLERDDSGRLTALIVDIKKSSIATVEHKLQVAFYHEMLRQILSDRQVEFDRIDLGILFEGPKHQTEAQTPEHIAAAVDAKRTFGTERGILERIANASDYVDSIKDIVTGDGSTAEKIAEAEFGNLPFHLSYVCDACQYNSFCMKWCALNDDLSLIPQISQTEKGALHRNGIMRTSQLASLKELSSDGGSPTLRTPSGHEAEIRRLSTTWSIGPRLDEFIHRARQYRRMKKDDIEALTYLPGSGYGSLPYCDKTHNPNLVRIYLDAQHDYLTDRIYLLGALISGAESGRESEKRRRIVVRMTEQSPDDESEAELIEGWIADVLQAVVEVAAPDEQGEPKAPIHLIFFDELTQARLLEGLGRHATQILSATPLYDFVTQLAAFSSSLITYLTHDIRDHRNYPVLCQSLYLISGFLKFDWRTPLNFRELFKKYCFDSWSRFKQPVEELGRDDGWYTGKARFSSLIPLDYAYTAWGERDSDRDAISYLGITTDIMRAFEIRRLEAMEHIARDFKGNKDTEKTAFCLPDLAAFECKARNLAQALDEFVVIERHVELAEWKRERLATPERRVLAGQTLVVTYLEADQDPEVAAQLRENVKRQELHNRLKEEFQIANPGKKFNKSPDQKAATAWTQDGLVVRLRFDTTAWECGVDEAISLSDFSPGDWIVLEFRWGVDSRLPEEEQRPYTPTPKQVLYGERAKLRKFIVERDLDGNALAAFAEIELMNQFGGGSADGFTFPGFVLPLKPNVSYTIDPNPNDINGYWQKKVTEGLIAGGANTLYSRLIAEAALGSEWPELAVTAQRRFLDGLEAFRARNLFEGFEESKRRFLTEHGATPILLVQGPPGTGKSFTTGFVVMALMQGAMAAGLDQRVLVSCKTHAATDVLLDNIRGAQDQMRRLKTKDANLFRDYFDSRLFDIPMFRLNPQKATQANPIPLTLKSSYKKNDVKPIDQIVGYEWCVCAGTPGAIYRFVKGLSGDSLFGHEIFDTLVLDEASQMGLPEAIMASLPLKMDGRIIVVGDPRQMPPIIKHDWENEARRSFKEFRSYRSLFDTLLELEPRPPMIQFEQSFRLQSDMAAFLGREIYSKDGIKYFSSKREPLNLSAGDDPFVQAVLSSDHAIVVVVHDESRSQVANEFEQSLVCEIGETISAIPDSEFDAVANVGIVVPHRKQRAALQQALPKLSQMEEGDDTPRGSAIDTVERFQGGERTLILISATESDPQFILSTSEFILDQRRLTVALSRAKKKLILVASESIFQVFSPDERVFENAQMWKNLLRRTCTELLWEGDRRGHRVRVYGNMPEQAGAHLQELETAAV